MAHAKSTTVASTSSGTVGGSGIFTLSMSSNSAQSRQQQQRTVTLSADPSEWEMADIDQGLASTFEGSLSGLGVDLSSSAFNMSDAIMSLSPGGGGFTSGGVGIGAKFISSNGSESSNFSALERQLELTGGVVSDSASKFNFVLLAGTSPAVKVNEEPLTYLNQGQSYEIKMSYGKRGDKPRLLKSIFRVSFHERRMQFMEKEHLDYWRQSRPSERILDVDAALSYNARQVYAVPFRINVAEVEWEGAAEPGQADGGSDSNSGGASAARQADCGVFVKLHCISTEFTARKHGGEKGVPFRLQIDTFDCETADHLSSVAAQVKVFKPKGADRKHKTDREKVEKRSDAERSKYQPALPYTPFLALSLLADGATGDGGLDSAQHSVAAFSIGDHRQQQQQQQPSARRQQHPTVLVKQEAVAVSRSVGAASAVNANATTSVSRHSHESSSSLVGAGGAGSDCGGHQTPETTGIVRGGGGDTSDLGLNSSPLSPGPLSQTSSSQQVSDWLERSRFHSGLLRAFQHFNGADMLQLSRSDLIEICGISDGIRLCNALMQRPCRARLVFYVGQETENVFHPVYLNQLTYLELFAKVTSLFQSDSDKITQILVYGPGDITVCISDEMVGHLQNEAKFTLHVLADPVNAGRFRIIMKEYRNCDE